MLINCSGLLYGNGVENTANLFSPWMEQITCSYVLISLRPALLHRPMSFAGSAD
jgi:hypothetical protein